MSLLKPGKFATETYFLAALGLAGLSVFIFGSGHELDVTAVLAQLKQAGADGTVDLSDAVKLLEWVQGQAPDKSQAGAWISFGVTVLHSVNRVVLKWKELDVKKEIAIVRSESAK